MSKYIRYAFALIGLLIAGTLVAGTPGEDDITEKAFKLLKETIEQNRQNDLEGYSYRNKYVIEINLDEKWIDERGKGDKVLASKYESISQRLNEFNNQRADKLRAYVVVVNDWELRLKQHINIDLLPSSVKLDAISEQAEANQSEEKTRIKKELNQVPLDVYQKLKDAGYTDMAICFGANVKFYTVDAKGTPAPRLYKYSTVVFSGQKLKAYKEQIRSKIVSTSGATLENDIEMKVFSMTDGIEEIVDQQKPLSLAYKISNPTVNNWFSSIGEKTTDPYSGANTAKQVYDYTGVFSSLTKQIVDQLPDPTAQVIITDNLTSAATIENIKAQVEKPLAGNVFWFHLDRKGELQTQLFLAETVKTRLGKLSANTASDLDLYIGNLYKQAGPKIKSAADLVDYLNINSHIFKALGFVLDKATIPSSWWDASSPDYLLGVWGKYIAPDAGYTFAYICGVWNGVIGNLSMVSGLLSLSSELQGAFIKILVDDTYRNEVFSDLQFYFTNITTLIDFGYEMVKSEVSQKVQAEWEKLKNGDATGVAYVAGLATVEVVIGIYTGGTVEAIKAGLMSFKLIRIPVEFIVSVGKTFIKPLAWILRQGIQLAFEAGSYIFRQGKEIILKIYTSASRNIVEVLRWVDDIEIDIQFPAYEIQFAEQWEMAVIGGESEALGGKTFKMVKTKDGKFGIRRKTVSQDGIEQIEIPSLADGAFKEWFDNLTPDEFDEIWKVKALRDKIESRLRHPGGLHEWCMVSRTNVFKRWNVSFDQIKAYRTPIEKVKFVNKDGYHGGPGSTAAHNEILQIIDKSLSFDDFKRQLSNWANYRLEGGVEALPKELQWIN